MSEINQINTSTDNNTKTPMVAQVSTPAEGTVENRDSKVFAAIRHEKQKAKNLAMQADAKLKQAEQLQSQYSELDSLSTDQILERIATKRGKAPEDLIQDYVTKKLGASPPEDHIKNSQDPAVQALAKQLEEQHKAFAELQKKLEEKVQSEEQAKHQVAFQQVQNDCLSAATEAWSDDSDYPMFFADQRDLSAAVYQFAVEQVQAFRNKNGEVPDDEDIKDLIKAAPQYLIEKKLASPMGQRVAALKTAVPKRSGIKPKLNIPSSIVSQPSPKTELSTRFDRQARLEAARKAIPANARFPGQH